MYKYYKDCTTEKYIKVRVLQIVQKGTRAEISRNLDLSHKEAGFFVNIEELKDE